MELEVERNFTKNVRSELCRLNKDLIYPSIPLERLLELRSKVSKIPELTHNPEIYYMNREEILDRTIRYSRVLNEFAGRENLTEDEFTVVLRMFAEGSPIGYSLGFFRGIFIVQASQAQKDKYLPLIDSMKIVGSFAQTELGHGSNVRGIETTATYEPRTGMFVINSPTLTSTKWWIGNLGINSNYAIVIARLILNDSDYGPHPFFIQLRDLETHEPFEGVELGDIGPKLGINSIDNGYARFESSGYPENLYSIDSLM